jgi:hypothetical protein
LKSEDENFISVLMKRKFKQWWLIILPISTKQTTMSLTSNNRTQKKTITCCIANLGPSLGQAHTYGRVKPVYGITTFALWKLDPQ